MAVVLVAIPVGVYSLADPERLDITDAVRKDTPGQFVRLTDGYTHFELAGPPGGHVVVLAAGFSVPYYIWDPTFKALTDAGFRVLRYDYYGRGFSDRPDKPYNDDFYVRQLTDLLDSQGIVASIDLAGLSFGGTVMTNFADKYPARVRSLIYVDPSFRSPISAPSMADMPWAWNYLHRHLRRTLVGGRAARRFSCIRSAFRTGPHGTACRCSIEDSVERGCPRSSPTWTSTSGRRTRARRSASDGPCS